LRGRHGLRGQHGNEPDAEVEDFPHLVRGDMACLLQRLKQRRQLPRPGIHDRLAFGRQNPHQITGDAPARDVGHSMNLTDHRLNGLPIAAVDGEQCIRHGPGTVRERRVDL
jgi:hypothetical protein